METHIHMLTSEGEQDEERKQEPLLAIKSPNICNATSVLACVFTILALFVFVGQLFTLPKGQRFLFTGILQLIACLCIMTAASIYTAQLHTTDKEGGYGHCYILAWISFVLTLFLTITYVVLRKRSE
ncbi:hypothetical protein XENOCAPTIV_002183 [Xenoophorus captivus]|uniref:Epithelial membrane protein 1 n=1 Tax=Xenoophorus captivus TaxID=1517983 RepID=A0ABV0QH46_9TELE